MDILKIQLALKKMGLFKGKCTGDWDDYNTKIAIRNFQQYCNLVSDGLLDKVTVEKLEQLEKKYDEWEALAYTE